MNVLIVDDDRFVVEALIAGINWSQLGFSNIHKAYNISTAKALIETSSIDLLLSDIDMPQGSGLELLEWIRSMHNDMPVIFLTNYADFSYAQKAVELKSFHYFLKPIEFDQLTRIIEDATSTLSTQNAMQDKLVRHFWNSFLHGEIDARGENLQRYFIENKLPYSMDTLLLPILFDLTPEYLSDDHTLHSHFKSTQVQWQYMQSTFASIFTAASASTDLFLEYDGECSRYLAILQCETDVIPASLRMACDTMIFTVKKQTHSSLRCFIGIPSCPENFLSHFNALLTRMGNTLDVRDQTIVLTSSAQTASESKSHALDHSVSLDVDLLAVYLESGQYNAFLSSCQQYLKQSSDCHMLDRTTLNNFQIDAVQILYSFLKRKNILAHKLFHGPAYHHLSVTARLSTDHMNLYLQYLVLTAQDYLDFSTSEKSVAKSIQDYVDLHYADDISRSSLSDILFLDPDYASKLFKKETGISFGNYLIQKRIEIAKELLCTTTLPINSISDQVGYGNYSYFIRLFKKTTGMTPIEFRNCDMQK